MPPQLRQEVPHHVRHGLPAAAGGGLRRELHQELLHRVQDDGLRHPRQDMQPEARQELRQTRQVDSWTKSCRVGEVTFQSNLVTSYTPLVTVSSITFQLQLHVYSRQEVLLKFAEKWSNVHEKILV